MKLHPILIYGNSGLGKTALIGQLVRVLLPRFGPGARARLVTAEHYNTIQQEIDDGLIEVWKVNTRDYPFETMRAAVDGCWPEDATDPTSPIQAPDYPMLRQRYPIRIFEGIATCATYLAGSYARGGIADRIGHGESIGPTDSGELIRIVDGSAEIGGMSRSNYGFAQKEMTSLLQRSQKHGGFILWSTHEDDMREKKGKVATGNIIVGPEVIGEALTVAVMGNFADCWRLVGVPEDFVQADGSIRRALERRLYVKQHVDPSSGSVTAVGKNSVGIGGQEHLPDYFLLTDPERPGLPRVGVAETIIEKLRL